MNELLVNQFLKDFGVAIDKVDDSAIVTLF